jgi:ribosome-interacting GTPase 1
MKDPFTLPRGSNVHDLACHIHRQLAESQKTARAWNAPGIHDGQNVPRDHVLTDKEIIELHLHRRITWIAKKTAIWILHVYI